MGINAERKKELREQYENRHPDMGIVAWKSASQIWVMPSSDAKADYNSTSFQLKLGSWPNKEMQKAYNESPNSFVWSIEEKLDYKDFTEDYTDDLTLMLMEYIDKHPEAKPMRPIRGLCDSKSK